MSKYVITVSVATPRGRRPLRTFSRYPADHLGWWDETPYTRKQLSRRKIPGCQWPSQWPPPARPGTRPGEPTEGTVHITDGVDTDTVTLTFVLDTLRSNGRHNVDLEDFKSVARQIASHITQLDALGDDQRRHAEQALEKFILLHCATE